MSTIAAKRITLATIKTFIKKNRESLMICTKSNFDGMEDGIRHTGNTEFSPALESDSPCSNNLGIQGAWFVLGSRDYLSAFEDASHVGIEVSNSCGNFILAVSK